MLVAECLTSLLFPFQWTLLYVPIVFTAALVCLDVPVPAIMGICINKSNINSDGKDVDDDDRYSDTSDELTFEVQRCIVHIDTGHIQLPDDMPRFPDRTRFINELNNILSRFNNYIHSNLARNSFKNKVKYQKSEDWTHIDDQNLLKESNYEPSQALARLAAIAKRAGIVVNNNNNNNDENNTKSLCLFNESELRRISANNCLRASFVNRFAQLFSQMDAFICYPPVGKYSNVDQWLAQRSTTKNFDRTMFIADQPKPHVPFLLAFMETQSFVSFVDSKIAAKFNEDNHLFGLTNKHLQYFSDRIRLYCDRRDLTYQCCPLIDSIDEETRLRFTSPIPPSLIVMNVPLVHPIDNSYSTSKISYLFENLNGSLLESTTSIDISSSLSSGIPKRNSHITRSFQTKHPKRRTTRLKKQQTVATYDHQQPVVLVENDVVFQQLLKECTTKTKRMVIEKMEDIVEGSSTMKNVDSSSMVNLEENVLIAGFCDLLERTWSHGLHHKPNGKSALWNHIKYYVKLKNYESAQMSHAGLPLTLNKDENPVVVWCLMRKQLVNRSASASRSQSPSNHRSHTLPRPQMSQHQSRSSALLATANSTLNLTSSDNMMKDNQSNTSLVHDFHSIESCFGHNPVSVSASEIGFARAFVRLALERRLLSRHLSELFSNSDLLQALYKREAFLRADDGDLRKQFLAHIESLQLLDYKCFSNSYPDIDIIYHVIIVPTRARTTGISSTTSANPYIALAGILGSTKVISLPSKNTLEIKFKHKNLGQLTTLRIGHDNSGLMPRWNIDHVLVRNQLTNNVYRFPCGRWLGKGVDDDSLERVLFIDSTYAFETNDNNSNGFFDFGSPSQLMTTSFISGGSQANLSVSIRSRSPSLRRSIDQKNQSNNQQTDDIYELLGRSINQLVKYFDEPEKKRGLITPILCGEDGIVNALEKTLSCGLKKSTGNVPFFGGGRKRYVWDFLIKVCDEYDGRRSQWQRTKLEKTIICYINGVRSIEKGLSTFGKDGRFQSWCCLACKLHLLSDWFQLLSQCSDACLQQFYDPLNNCFRQEKLNQFIINILEPVKDFDFAHLEPALLKGLAGV
ncbi:unnamed protein product [Rotaria sp. Silwood2]|nr:unnamed protein product [Rotaria sp. Silwood2]